MGTYKVGEMCITEFEMTLKIIWMKKELNNENFNWFHVDIQSDRDNKVVTVTDIQNPDIRFSSTAKTYHDAFADILAEASKLPAAD